MALFTELEKVESEFRATDGEASEESSSDDGRGLSSNIVTARMVDSFREMWAEAGVVGSGFSACVGPLLMPIVLELTEAGGARARDGLTRSSGPEGAWLCVVSMRVSETEEAREM